MSIVNYQESGDELKRIFSLLNNSLFNGSLKEPEISIVDRRNRRTLSWFKTDEWNSGKVQSFYFSKEVLQCSSYELINHLIRLMVYLKNHQEGLKDVSLEGYHNKHFKKSAEEVGLKTELTKYNGYEKTELGEDLKKVVDSLEIKPSVINQQVKVEKKKDSSDKYDFLTVKKETKEMIRTFCTLTNKSMIEVTEEAFAKYMEEYKK